MPAEVHVHGRRATLELQRLSAMGKQPEAIGVQRVRLLARLHVCRSHTHRTVGDSIVLSRTIAVMSCCLQAYKELNMEQSCIEDQLAAMDTPDPMHFIVVSLEVWQRCSEA